MEKGDKVYYMYLTLGGDVRIYRAEYISENPEQQRGLNMHSIRLREVIYDNVLDSPKVGKSYTVSGEHLWRLDKIPENIEKYKTVLFRMIFHPWK